MWFGEHRVGRIRGGQASDGEGKKNQASLIPTLKIKQEKLEVEMQRNGGGGSEKRKAEQEGKQGGGVME